MTIREDEVRVVIIGAGCAGLTAAKALSRKGIIPVVYEARNRVGGRILTVETGLESHPPFHQISMNGNDISGEEHVADAGASSMHGCKDREQLVYRRSVFSHVSVPANVGYNLYETTRGAAWYCSGKRIPQSQVIFMHDFFDVVRAKVAAYASKIDDPESIALRPVWNRYVRKISSSQLGENLTERRRCILFKIEQRWLGMNNSTMNSSLYSMTAYNTDEVPELRMELAKRNALEVDKQLASNNMPKIVTAKYPSNSCDTCVVDGYTGFLIDNLKKGLDIRLKKVVREIRAHSSQSSTNNSSSRCIRVKTSDGEENEFDYAIVTIPLGVLKSQNLETSVTFSPELSRTKKRAISTMGMGVHNKVILRFRERDIFWPPSIPHLNCLDKRFQFFNLNAFGKPGVILAHVFSESGYLDELQRSSDKKVVQEVVNVLHGMFCTEGKWTNKVHRTVWVSKTEKMRSSEKVAEKFVYPDNFDEKPNPVFSIVTRWDSDPYSLGSYSCLPIGAVFGDIAEFRKPEKMGGNKNVLFFAGEHVSDPEFGWQCVNGAYDTGLMAAYKLLVSAGVCDDGEHWSHLDEFSSRELMSKYVVLERKLKNVEKTVARKVSLLENRFKEAISRVEADNMALGEKLERLTAQVELDGKKKSVELVRIKEQVAAIREKSTDYISRIAGDEEVCKNSAPSKSREQRGQPANQKPGEDEDCKMGSLGSNRRKRCSFCDVMTDSGGKNLGKRRTSKQCTTCNVFVCPAHFLAHVRERNKSSRNDYNL